MEPGHRRTAARIVVRPATEQDAGAVAAINVDAWRAAYPGLMPGHILAGLDEAEIRERNLHWLGGTDWPRRGLLVAEAAGTIAGYAWLGPSRDPEAGGGVGEVSAIYLAPAWWRHGIGRQLLTAAEQTLRQAGFRSATLWVLTGNAPARRFYESCGWAPDGATKTDVWQGAEFDETRYAVTL